jgi:hypothetical protein
LAEAVDLDSGPTKYPGLNVPHLCQKLNAAKGFSVSRETVRRILRGRPAPAPQRVVADPGCTAF